MLANELAILRKDLSYSGTKLRSATRPNARTHINAYNHRSSCRYTTPLPNRIANAARRQPSRYSTLTADLSAANGSQGSPTASRCLAADTSESLLLADAQTAIQEQQAAQNSAEGSLGPADKAATKACAHLQTVLRYNKAVRNI